MTFEKFLEYLDEKVFMKPQRYKYGDVIIRERKGRYYVYLLERSNGVERERYVGPLTDVVQKYLKVKEGNESRSAGVSPTADPPGLEPGTTGSEGRRSVLAELRVLNHYYYNPLTKCLFGAR